MRPIRANVWCAMWLIAATAPIGGDARLQAQTVEETARRSASAKVRPGDVIELQFRRDRELNSSVHVTERGEAVFPKLGTLSVTDVSIGALQDTLHARYAEYLRSPEVEVNVLRRVVVNGEVKVPNVYMLDVSSGVRDAIARAGGLMEAANKKRVYIIRGGQRIRVKDWERSQGPDTDLQSGDQIVVGRQSWLKLNALPVISTSVIVIGLIRSLK
jgi:protein involved in polysaccharide export with SLBB domain